MGNQFLYHLPAWENPDKERAELSLKKTFALLLALSVLLTLCACGGAGGAAITAEPSPEQTAEPTPEPTPEPTSEPRSSFVEQGSPSASSISAKPRERCFIITTMIPSDAGKRISALR